jgi:extradiol dioxygenase family protein
MSHFVFSVINLKDTSAFYVNSLDCKNEGASSNCENLKLGGNAITVHEKAVLKKLSPISVAEGVPENHFVENWLKVKEEALFEKTNFLEESKVMFKGQIGGQDTFFDQDSNGYAFELKGLVDFGNIF